MNTWGIFHLVQQKVQAFLSVHIPHHPALVKLSCELLSEVCPISSHRVKVVSFVCMHRLSCLSVGLLWLGTKEQLLSAFVSSGVIFVLQNYGFECLGVFLTV